MSITTPPTRRSIRAAERAAERAQIAAEHQNKITQRRTAKMKQWASGGAIFAISAGLSLTAVLPATAADEDMWDNALEVLETIEVRDSDTVDVDYERSEWGGWLTNPDTGCTTQEDILKRDTIPETQVLDTDDDCRLIFGESEDPYSGDHVIHDRDDVEFNRTPFDVDHVVALSDAHHSGGYAWDRDEKREFSQDQENLVASLASINRQKSNHNLDNWLPPSQDRYYEYVSTVIYVKDKYDLSMTQAEYDVAESILNDEGYEDTLASPAITMTLNYREAQEDEPTEEPTDEPTDEQTEEPTPEPSDDPTETETPEPSEEPTDEPTDDVTDEPTEEPTEEETPTPEPTDTETATEAPSAVPSLTATVTSLPVDSVPSVVPAQPSQENTQITNEPLIIEEDEDNTPTFDTDDGDGETGSTGDDFVAEDPLLNRDDVFIDEDGDVSVDRNDAGTVDRNDADSQDSIGNLTEADDQEIERLADAGPGDWTAWAAGGALASIALGAFFVFRAQVSARKH